MTFTGILILEPLDQEERFWATSFCVDSVRSATKAAVALGKQRIRCFWGAVSAKPAYHALNFVTYSRFSLSLRRQRANVAGYPGCVAAGMVNADDCPERWVC